MTIKEITIFAILLLLLACGKLYAMNIGVSQTGGTNIGVGQYEAVATTNTTNFFLLF